MGILILANVIAVGAVIKPWGGSPEELDRQLAQLRSEAQQREVSLERVRKIVATVEKTRAGANGFLDQHFLPRRSAYSTILDALSTMAQEAHVRVKEHSFISEPVEGSGTMEMMVITGNYEGNYANLLEFVHKVDHSSHFITIDTLQATPVQGQPLLNVNMKLNVFVREEGPVQ